MSLQRLSKFCYCREVCLDRIQKHMTDIARNEYTDGLQQIIKQYDNAVYTSIKKKPKDLTCNT